MNVNDFCSILEKEMKDTDIIKISVSKAKGFVSLFWFTTFKNHSNVDWFEKNLNEIQLANQEIIKIGKKYPELYQNHTIITRRDVEHFDYRAINEKVIPVKKIWQTDTQSFGGSVTFKYPK